jgi:hypothetical protein
MAVASQLQAIDKLEEKLSSQRWRLNNLYQIKNKQGQMVPYKFNWAQERLYSEMHYLNIILKARQLGCTTFIDLLFLDTCLFNSNKNAGIIAHHQDDAKKIFEEKILIPYENLDESLKAAIPTDTKSKSELQFANHSYIRVGTSMRSATLQYLHVSEYGITCARFPDKAQEIRTGALNTVQAGQIAFIESTSKGRIGHFPELWDQAYDLHKRMSKLSKLDWRIFFFPWFDEPEYEIEPVGMVFGARELEYFEDLAAKHNVHLSERKKAWYSKKWETLGPAIKQEYPSTPEEAWEGGGILLNWNSKYHEIEEGPWPPPQNAPMFMGFDYGFSAPFSAGWYWTDYDGRIYRAREWYGYNGNPNEGIRLTPSEIAEGIKKREIQWGIWGRVKRRIAGSDCFSRRLNPKTGELGPTIDFEFSSVDPGLALEQANDKNRLACVAQVHERLRVKFSDEGELLNPPMFQVYKKACPQFLRTVPSIPSDPHKVEDAWSDGEDHIFDEFKYVMSSWPMVLTEAPKPKTAPQRIIEAAEQRFVSDVLPWELPQVDGEGSFLDGEKW